MSVFNTASVLSFNAEDSILYLIHDTINIAIWWNTGVLSSFLGVVAELLGFL